LWKRNLCARFVPRYFHTWAKERSSHILPNVIALADADTNFLINLLGGMRPGVFPMTPKQSDRFLSGLVRHPVGQRNLNSKGPASRPCWCFFLLSMPSVQRIHTRGKTVNAGFYKRVMGCLLKCIHLWKLLLNFLCIFIPILLFHNSIYLWVFCCALIF